MFYYCHTYFLHNLFQWFCFLSIIFFLVNNHIIKCDLNNEENMKLKTVPRLPPAKKKKKKKVIEIFKIV